MKFFNFFLILLNITICYSKINFKISNRSGYKLDFFWKNPTGELVKQLAVFMRNNTDHYLTSYAGHTFVAKLAENQPHKINDVSVTLTDLPNLTYFIYYNETSKEIYGSLEKTRGKLENLIKTKTSMCWDAFSSEDSIENLKECIESSILETVSTEEEEERRLLKYRNLMAKRLRNYTCDDPTLEVLPATPLKTVNFKHLDKNYNVNFYLNHTDAKIFAINETFVTPEECEYLMNEARPRLSTATVSSGGGAVVSNARRAQQANVSINDRSSPVWSLYRRILDTVNYFTAYNIQPEGQEGLNVIQYNPGDEYISHCDGACDGSRHKKGGRVATAVLYCHSPEKGGATTFTKADVLIKGKPGQVTFFSYYENDSDGKGGIMDRTGFTEHSGCGITEGEKWIATAWLRLGVDENDPYTKYDPLGNLHDYADDSQSLKVKSNFLMNKFGNQVTHDEF